MGNGHGGKPGDKEKKERSIIKEVKIMKSIIISVLTGGVILLVFSCATVPAGPLAPGEVRLLRMDATRDGVIRLGLPFTVNINFEAGGRPEIKRACFFWSGDGPYCFQVMKLDYGLPGTIHVEILTKSFGEYFLESYALYVQDGKIRRTNVVGTHINIIR